MDLSYYFRKKIILRKEFQALLERTKTNVGSGTFFLAFSKMNEICLSTDDSSEKV